MKVLLTGATGFLGYPVLRALQQRGIDVVAIGRTAPKMPVEFIQADLLNTTDFSVWMRTVQPTHLLHLAWYAEHGKFWTSPLNLRWLDASLRLTEAFCNSGHGVHAVFAGTCAEYDWTHGYCREDTTPLHPATLYGTAKDATRRMVMAICQQSAVSCSWGRVFLPIGPNDSPNRLLPSLIDVFQGTRPPFGVNATAFRDFLHTADVAEAFVHLLLEQAAGLYNISSGEPIRLEQLVRILAEIMHTDPGPVLELSCQRPEEPPLLVGENIKLKKLGWVPALTLPQALEQILQAR